VKTIIHFPVSLKAVNFWLAKQQPASEGRHCSMELIRYKLTKQLLSEKNTDHLKTDAS
jgi:hypothetical protein